MYKRKTRDVWEVQGYYERSTGWECLTTETSIKAAWRGVHIYDVNEPHYQHRIVKKREPITEGNLP